VLTSNGKRDLRHQAHDLDVRDAADELIASADTAESRAALAYFAAVGSPIEKFIDLLLGDTMMTAGGLDGADLAFINPLFERGIADPQDLGGFARRE